MKSYIAFLIFLLSLKLPAQQADVTYRVAKPINTLKILPAFDTLMIGKTYDLLIPDTKTTDIKDLRSTFGTLTYHQSRNGKDIELKLTVGINYIGKGTISCSSIISKKTISKEYRIVAKTNTSPVYMPMAPAPNANYNFCLMMNNDTLPRSGKISMKQLKAATTLSLTDPEIPAGTYIRKNLMCQIKLIHDTSTVTLYSALDRLTDKVKLGLSKAKPGDKILIENMENMWIDAKRDDHITPYGAASYSLTITE